jgi:hypothetical protein
MIPGSVALLAGIAAFAVRGAPVRAKTADDVRAVAVDQEPNFEKPSCRPAHTPLVSAARKIRVSLESARFSGSARKNAAGV